LLIASCSAFDVASSDAAAAAFYDAAIQRKVTLAQALQAAQLAVPEAAGRLALYADPTTRLRA
jgi:CHAT domain-containing protein